MSTSSPASRPSIHTRRSETSSSNASTNSGSSSARRSLWNAIRSKPKEPPLPQRRPFPPPTRVTPLSTPTHIPYSPSSHTSNMNRRHQIALTSSKLMNNEANNQSQTSFSINSMNGSPNNNEDHEVFNAINYNHERSNSSSILLSSPSNITPKKRLRHIKNSSLHSTRTNFEQMEIDAENEPTISLDDEFDMSLDSQTLDDDNFEFETSNTSNILKSAFDDYSIDLKNFTLDSPEFNKHTLTETFNNSASDLSTNTASTMTPSNTPTTTLKNSRTLDSHVKLQKTQNTQSSTTPTIIKFAKLYEIKADDDFIVIPTKQFILLDTPINYNIIEKHRNHSISSPDDFFHFQLEDEEYLTTDTEDEIESYRSINSSGTGSGSSNNTDMNGYKGEDKYSKNLSKSNSASKEQRTSLYFV